MEKDIRKGPHLSLTDHAYSPLSLSLSLSLQRNWLASLCTDPTSGKIGKGAPSPFFLRGAGGGGGLYTGYYRQEIKNCSSENKTHADYPRDWQVNLGRRKRFTNSKHNWCLFAKKEWGLFFFEKIKCCLLKFEDCIVYTVLPITTFLKACRLNNKEYKYLGS